MAWDTRGPLDALVTILEGLAGLQEVYTGVPASIGRGVSAYVALAGQTVRQGTMRVLRREAGYFVGLCYRVESAPGLAETTVADLVDAFCEAVLADRTLGGLAVTCELDLALASAPEYQVVAGQEFRIYPIRVHVTQDHTP